MYLVDGFVVQGHPHTLPLGVGEEGVAVRGDGEVPALQVRERELQEVGAKTQKPE